MWPFNREWPLNGGSTAIQISLESLRGEEFNGF